MKLSVWRSRALVTAHIFFLVASLHAQDASTEKTQTMRSILDHTFPRLVLVLTFDQLRADMLTRYSNQYLPAYGSDGEVGGFRWLMETGAVMADTHYNHVPLHTGPGHATIMTGAAPRLSGIVGNSWYTSAGLSMNCVGDPDVSTIGVPDSPTRRGSSSPKNLLAETVGDELKFANNRQSKVIGIGIKDRGSILPTGHDADAAVWFDANHGKWVSSTWYSDTGLPAFAQRANDGKLADRWLGQSWDYLMPAEAYKISMPENMEGVGAARGLSASFPKLLSEPGAAPDRDYYNHLIFTPFGNEMVFETAKLAVEYEKLGQDLYPDILAISFSTTDLVGHSWGPHSREAQDTMLRADRQLSGYLNFLKSSLPGGLDNALIILTSDHGGAALPEWVQTRRFPSERILYKDIIANAEDALAAQFPDKQTTGLVLFSDPYLSFREGKLAERGIDITSATDVIAERLRSMPGISAAYTREQIESGNLPRIPIAQSVTNGFNPDRSGAIVLLTDPFSYNSRSETGTTHGTGYNYDTHVPLVFTGNRIRAGVYTDRADVRDIAPTLSFLLGISAPASSEGRILSDIIK